ncbi:porphobilinogen synthase [Rhodothermaceae bacterium RA]|nr:porphobilinogen synthase [Rhodothermaceae bacterium RA]
MIPPTAPIASLIHRPRRLRRTDALRRMVRETRLSPDRLIAPLFVVDGRDVCQPIPSMPDQFRLSIDRLVQECRELAALGIPAVALFPKIDEALKTPDGRESLNPDGLFPRAIRAVKDAVPDLMVVTDVALDPYSSQGHDGLVRGGQIVNDETLAILAEMAVVQARAGADVIAPSDMMDGRVAAIRQALDEAGFTDTAILAYTAKYASAFYGPFRDALDSAPRAEADVPADKQTYQMDPANAREALRELMLDLDEGADMVMVKPAVPYLDIIRRFKDAADVPVAAYHVSGEYAMIKAAARNGWLDEAAAMTETLTAIHRAGADVILTYFARTFAERF